MPSYVLGDKPPPVTPDAGSGPWCSAPPTLEYAAYKSAIELAMLTPLVQIKVGPDAVAHMRHYLSNTGTDYHVDLSAMMSKSQNLRRFHDAELEEAKRFAQSLEPGAHAITSSRLRTDGFEERDEPYYFYAVGGYSYWGQGTVRIEDVGKNQRRITLDFQFHFYDRYNWDTGKKTGIGLITVRDNFLQELHRRCYAREYDLKGEIKKQVVWEVTLRDSAAKADNNPFRILNTK
jgi:hypothetical protein